MIEVIFSEGFLKTAKKFPKNIQKKLAILLNYLKQDPFHPLLHSKHLTGELSGYLSFRITRDYRVIFRFIDLHTIQLLRAADRKDVYR